MRKTISEKTKKEVVERQFYQCANHPLSPPSNLQGYRCLLYLVNDGIFDESGYEIDHISEHCIDSDDSIANLQALCPNCHKVKTRRFMTQSKPKGMARLTSVQLGQGGAYMEIDQEGPTKKRKI